MNEKNINVNFEEFAKKVHNNLKNRLIAIGMAMVRDIKMSMRGYGQYSRLDTWQLVKGSLRQRGRNRKYHYPSPPGSSPAVDTGRLRASISINWVDSGIGRGKVDRPALENDGVGMPESEKNKIKVVVGTNVEYGAYLELGTSKMEPRPYLRPVLEKYRDKIRRLSET